MGAEVLHLMSLSCGGHIAFTPMSENETLFSRQGIDDLVYRSGLMKPRDRKWGKLFRDPASSPTLRDKVRPCQLKEERARRKLGVQGGRRLPPVPLLSFPSLFQPPLSPTHTHVPSSSCSLWKKTDIYQPGSVCWASCCMS